MAEIQSAQEFLAICKKWDWDDPEFADELRARDKAMVERIREKIDKHGIITRQWQLNSILDDVLRDLGIE